MPKSLNRFETVVALVSKTGFGGASQSFFTGGRGLGGGAIGLLFACRDFCGGTRGGGVSTDSASILRMFAVRDNGPRGTEGGPLMILLGFVALTSGIAFFSSGTSNLAAVFVPDFESRECAFGSSSKSSSEKSKSWAERGAAESANTQGCAKPSCDDFWGAESAKSSRAICVPLSRKSSQPSRASCAAAGTCKEVGGFEETELAPSKLGDLVT